MDKILVRNAVEGDFQAIADLALNCSPMITERNSIYHIFTKFFQNTVFLAEIEDEKQIKKAIGFLIGFMSQKNKEDAYIHLLCVHPSCRGMGIATVLIKNFLKVVIEMGCKRVYLITKPVNKNAIDFYTKMGFKKNQGYKTDTIDGEEVVKDYNGKGEHMIVFQKFISD